VIKIPEKNASELYKNANIFIQKNYKSPQNVIKGQVDGDFLSFYTHTNRIAQYRIPLNGNTSIEADFTIRLEFKDSKVKFDITDFDMYYYANSSKVKFNINQSLVGWYIFKKNGDITKRAETTKVEIENYFNSFIIGLKNGLSGTQEKNDDW